MPRTATLVSVAYRRKRVDPHSKQDSVTFFWFESWKFVYFHVGSLC